MLNVNDELDNGNDCLCAFGLHSDPSNAGCTTADMRAGRVGLKGDFGDVAWGSGEMVYEIGQIIDGHGQLTGMVVVTTLQHTQLLVVDLISQELIVMY